MEAVRKRIGDNMDYIMTNHELCGRLLHIAEDLKTLYVMGGIGFPLNASGKKRAMQYVYNQSETRKRMIMNASDDTFAFDCVCLVKSILWGFSGDKNKRYGGALYASNGIPDCSITYLYNMGSKQSTDMSDIAEGEFLMLHAHHCGVYVGNGLVVESTPAWENKVQITKLAQRPWKAHCYLPKVKYEGVYPSNYQYYPYPQYTDVELAYRVIKGLHKAGEERKKDLGARYRTVQDIVNKIAKEGRP